MLEKKCEYTLLVGCRTQTYSLCGLDLLDPCWFFFFLVHLTNQYLRSSIRRHSLDFNLPVLRIWRGPEPLSKFIPTHFSQLFTSTGFLPCPEFAPREIWTRGLSPSRCRGSIVVSRFGKGRSKRRNLSFLFCFLFPHPPQGCLMVSPFLGVFLTWSIWDWSWITGSQQLC